MDFMKVLDQTVREIKREVNLKVLKVPEIEQKVLDATSDEPWGPHGSALSELAHATKKFTECQMIMNVLWTRLGDKSANWRHIYKALSVIEYLIANGSERAIDNILEQSFEYVEPNGKDVGINVRKKVETILALLEDKEKMQAVRNKADATRDKYFGLSSTGITYKSSSTSYSGSSFHQSDHYGTSSGTREDESFKDSFRDGKQNHGGSDGHTKSNEGFSKEKEGSRLKKGMLHSARGIVVGGGAVVRRWSDESPAAVASQAVDGSFAVVRRWSGRSSMAWWKSGGASTMVGWKFIGGRLKGDGLTMVGRKFGGGWRWCNDGREEIWRRSAAWQCSSDHRCSNQKFQRSPCLSRVSSASPNAKIESNDDEFDDFNPRGSSTKVVFSLLDSIANFCKLSTYLHLVLYFTFDLKVTVCIDPLQILAIITGMLFYSFLFYLLDFPFIPACYYTANNSLTVPELVVVLL
ncbi:Clathrin interactor EPSIN 1 [Dendrobium catenatum]|uniref:Clathrin interactor EPSIN 1 n=1 Tax=Dendrobium catenatum TaxID=906689 RepID=A0A2I0WSD6_9ASPA|nr:Clathrin interactor EPSIN 1 [Dendrobium catenatum]